MDNTGELVPHDLSGLDKHAGGEAVNIRTADTAKPDFDEHVTATDLWHGNVLDRYIVCCMQDSCFHCRHGVALLFDFTFMLGRRVAQVNDLRYCTTKMIVDYGKAGCYPVFDRMTSGQIYKYRTGLSYFTKGSTL